MKLFILFLFLFAGYFLSGQNITDSNQLKKDKHGELDKNNDSLPGNIVHYQDFEGIDLVVTNVQGNKKKQTVTINFYLFTHKGNQLIRIDNTRNEHATGVDINQTYYVSKCISLGSNNTCINRAITNELQTETKLNGSITLAAIPPSLTGLNAVSVPISSRTFDGGANFQNGTINIEKLKITWE